jgi:hypothetical protein
MNSSAQMLRERAERSGHRSIGCGCAIALVLGRTHRAVGRNGTGGSRYGAEHTQRVTENFQIGMIPARVVLCACAGLD